MYNNLKTEMTLRGVTIEDLASVTGTHRNTMANKINGSSSFDIEECFTIRDLKFPYARIEYLFKQFTSEVAG